MVSKTNPLRHFAVYMVKILSLLCILFVTGVLLLNEFDNKLAALLIAGCGFVVLFAAKRLLTKHAGIVENIFPAVLAGCVFFLFILQMAFSVILRFTPAWDMQAVYDGAISWVESGDFTSYNDYFYYFPNNLGLLTVLWAAFSAAKFIGIHDYFMVGCFLGALSVDTMAFCVAVICKKQMGSIYGVLSILVMLFFPPLYFAPTAFHTDVMSMFAPALCYLLYLYSKDCTAWKTRIAFYAGMAIVLAIGMEIKFPVAIMLIAIAIEALLIGGRLKEFAVMLTVNIAVIAMVFAAFHCAIYPANLSEEQAKTQNTPYLHWVMMGLNGGGSYNPEDYEFTRSFTDTKERDAAIIEKIKSRLQEMGLNGYYSLIKTKTAKMFDPTLGISDFLDDGPVNDTTLQQYVLYSGEHYSNYWIFCEGILLILFISMLFGAVGGLDAGENAFPMRLRVSNQFALRLAFLGLWIFLANWESSGRYYTNFLSVILICAIVGFDNSEKYLAAIAKFFKKSFCEREHLAI